VMRVFVHQVKYLPRRQQIQMPRNLRKLVTRVLAIVRTFLIQNSALISNHLHRHQILEIQYQEILTTLRGQEEHLRSHRPKPIRAQAMFFGLIITA
jgi:hypothetical protein